MKNIQVIDSGINCVYDIFAATDRDFRLLFPPPTNVAFIDEVFERLGNTTAQAVTTRLWFRPIRKSLARGVHGLLFYGLESKKAFYPGRRDEEAMNPDGTRLRAAPPPRRPRRGGSSSHPHKQRRTRGA